MIRFALICALLGLVVAVTYSGLPGALWFFVGAGILARSTREPEPESNPAPRPKDTPSTSVTYKISSRR